MTYNLNINNQNKNINININNPNFAKNLDSNLPNNCNCSINPKSDKIEINQITDCSFNNLNNKIFQFKKEFLNINRDDPQAQLDLIIKQKIQKKKTDAKNKSNYLNFTNPIGQNTNSTIMKHSTCKNNNNNSTTNYLESKYIIYLIYRRFKTIPINKE